MKKNAVSIGLLFVAANVSAGAAVHPAPPSLPNVLYIVADDLGYSDLGAFGSEIATPNLDRLAAAGRVLTNFHTSTACAVTRAMLYSGTDHHLVGLGTQGVPKDERKGLPGYEGYLNDRALSIAQLLKDGGYHTYIAGKWHLGSDITLRQTPDAWGFERSYVLLGGATSDHFLYEEAGSQNYAADGRYAQPGQPGQPGGDGVRVYDTDFYTRKLIEFIDSNRNDGKPFAAFATYTSPHWPLQVPEPYLSRYRGVYDVGYDVIRERRLERMKALGIIPRDFAASPTWPDTPTASPATASHGTPDAKYVNALHPSQSGDRRYVDYGAGRVNRKWQSLTPAERRLQARYMEVYAGMVENLDHNVGLLIEHLQRIGQYENTFIIFHSDNGPEPAPLSPEAEAKNLENFAGIGRSGSKVFYGSRWAEVSATPFNLGKSYTNEGGTSVPAIVRLPRQKHAGPKWNEFAHVRDVAPTLLALAGIDPPTQRAAPLLDASGKDLNAGKVIYKGRNVYPITGLALLQALRGTQSGPVHREPVGEEQYGRAYIRHGRWKAIFIEPPVGPTDGHWRLYDTEADRGEVNDVSGKHPDVLARLIGHWNRYMEDVGGVTPKKPGGYF